MYWYVCRFEDNNPPEILRECLSFDEAECFLNTYSNLQIELNGEDFFFEEALAGYNYGIVPEDKL